MFGPNKILIPITEFTISASIQCVSGHPCFPTKTLKFKVDLSKENEGISVISFNDGEIEFSAEF